MNISTIIRCIVMLGLIAAIFPSCEIINPAEEIPAYLKVDSVILEVSNGQGSASHKITDVWVDAVSYTQGVYEIPQLFPILENGNTYFVISGGILDNGIAATRAIYPFYFPDTFTIALQEKQIYPVTPHFTYRTTTKFSFIEDFEAGNIFAQLQGDSNMTRTAVASDIFEGNYSGYIYLDSSNTIYEGRTASSYQPANGPVYLELNYRCDQQFQVGIYGTNNTGSISLYKWNINPKETWNKIYLNLGNDIASSDAESVQIQIRAILDSDNTSAHIYLDNIKLVNF